MYDDAHSRVRKHAALRMRLARYKELQISDGGYGMENGTMEKQFDVVALRVMPSEEEVEALMSL